jgi:hypothetical protein
VWKRVVIPSIELELEARALRERRVIPGRSNIALVVGKKEAGKSRLIKRGLSRVSRFVVWDIKGEYADAQYGVAGARVWQDLAHWRDHLLGGGTIEREAFACPASQFDAWCRWVFATGNLTAVIEELPRYCNGSKPRASLADLFDRSRHAHIDLICSASRVALVPVSLRIQVDELVLSRLTEPNDCAYLESWLGGPTVARVRSLAPNTFLRIRP